MPPRKKPDPYAELESDDIYEGIVSAEPDDALSAANADPYAELESDDIYDGIEGYENEPEHQPEPIALGADRGPLQQPREPNFWEELSESAQSAVQGASMNLADDALDYFGAPEAAESMRASSEKYPYGHGAGQLATGLVGGAAAGARKLAQGAVGGAQSAISEYGDSHDFGRAAVAGGVGFVGGLAGAAIGEKAGKVAGNVMGRRNAAYMPVEPVDPIVDDIVRGGMSPADMKGPAFSPTPRGQGGRRVEGDYQFRPDPEPDPILRGPGKFETGAPPPGAPSPLDRGVAPREPVEFTPEVEPYDPLDELLQTGQGQSLRSPPAPLGPPAPGPSLVRGGGGKFRKPVPMSLDDSMPPGNYAEGSTMASPDDALDMRQIGMEMSGGGRSAQGAVEPFPLAPSAAPPSMDLVDLSEIGRLRPQSGPVDPIELPLGSNEWNMSPVPQPAPPQEPGGMGKMAQGAMSLAGMLPGLGKPMAAAKLLTGLASKPGMQYPANETAATGARMGAKAAWELGMPALTDGKVNAQESVAYADAPSRTWAVQSVLSAGDTGMAPEDEQALTSALASGEQDRVSAADYRLRQRYPRYAQRVEKALRGLTEE